MPKPSPRTAGVTVSHDTAGILTRQRGDAPQAFGLTVAGSGVGRHQSRQSVSRPGVSSSCRRAQRVFPGRRGPLDRRARAALYRAQKDASAARPARRRSRVKIFPGSCPASRSRVRREPAPIALDATQPEANCAPAPPQRGAAGGATPSAVTM